MKTKKINGELWTSFLKIYSSSGAEGKLNKKIMLAAIFAVLMIDAAAICWLAIKNQTQDTELLEEMMQMLLLLILSSGAVGFGVISKSSDKESDEENLAETEKETKEGEK